MTLLSIVIPSASDPCLQRTIDDLRQNAMGQVEIIAVLDGRWSDVKSSDEIVHYRPRRGMRAAINGGVRVASGDYIMKCDAHCKLSPGYDVGLLSAIEDNWVVVPRRYRLDIDAWMVMNDPAVDYDRIEVTPEKLHGVRWKSRAKERASILVDETPVFQGSCWVMARKHWDWLGGLSEGGYGTFTQEPFEIAMKTWLGGGKVMVNKGVWYAHKHRMFKRTVHIDSAEVAAGNSYSRDYWVNDRWPERLHDFRWLMERFGLW